MVQLLSKTLWRLFKKLKIELYMIQQAHFWVFVQKNRNQDLIYMVALLINCSNVHNS